MSETPIPDDEASRRASLVDLNVLDTPAEVEFDALAKVAALICGTPIALISLVDTDRQWFKANIGLEGVRETHRNVAFCAHAIMRDEVMEVSDARQDRRFSTNPLVTSKSSIRFYAGAPLKLNNGSRIGTLCVIDRQPKKLDDRQKEALHYLSVAVVEALKLRRAALSKHAGDAPSDVAETVTGEGSWEWNVLTGRLVVNDAWKVMTDCTRHEADAIDMELWQARFHPDDRARFNAQIHRLKSGIVDRLEGSFKLQHLNGQIEEVHIHGHVQLWTADDQPEWIFGTQSTRHGLQDATVADRPTKHHSAGDGHAKASGWQLQIASRKMVWDDQVCHLCGVSPGYLPELSEFFRFYPEDARLKLERMLDRAMSHGDSMDLELPFIRPSGEAIRVHITGTVEFDGDQPIRVTGSLTELDS
ncbi:MAG: PAS domain-containing protein [Burkholderiales bacterium]|nr:PAS domain-containing protein [Burkholderiales bacterium]